MGYTLLDGTICLGRCLCEALGVGKNEQGCGYLDEDVKHTHCCFALDLSVLFAEERFGLGTLDYSTLWCYLRNSLLFPSFQLVCRYGSSSM